MGSKLGRFLLCNTRNPLQHCTGGRAVFLPPALEGTHKKGKLQVLCFFSKVFQFFPGPFSTRMTQIFRSVCTVRMWTQIHTHQVPTAYVWDWRELSWTVGRAMVLDPFTPKETWHCLHPGPPSALETKSGRGYHTEHSSGWDWVGCWCCLLWDRRELLPVDMNVPPISNVNIQSQITLSALQHHRAQKTESHSITFRSQQTQLHISRQEILMHFPKIQGRGGRRGCFVWKSLSQVIFLKCASDVLQDCP